MKLTLTQKVANLLKETKLSISFIARKANLSRNYLYKIINNDICSISFENAKAICDILDYDINFLINNDFFDNENKNLNLFSTNLKKLRISNNLTQDQLAKIIGTSRSTIAMYETNASEPNHQVTILIAKHFNISIDYLLGNQLNTVTIKTPIQKPTFYRRLKNLRKINNITQEMLANSLYVATGTVAMWETNKRQPDYDMTFKIASYFNVSIDYLLGNSNIKNKKVLIPIFNKINSILPIEQTDDILDYEEIDSNLASTGSFFGLKVKGDSMSPQLLENDIVIIKQQQDFDNNDTCVVIVNGFDATLKRVKKDEAGLWLIPNNSAHQSQFYPANDVQSLPVNIIGKAIEIRRSL